MRFTRRKGALLMALAPLLFVFSGLFLANAVLHSPDSLPYVIGEFLCLPCRLPC